jgi:hypothetical protein
VAHFGVNFHKILASVVHEIAHNGFGSSV